MKTRRTKHIYPYNLKITGPELSGSAEMMKMVFTFRADNGDDNEVTIELPTWYINVIGAGLWNVVREKESRHNREVNSFKKSLTE